MKPEDARAKGKTDKGKRQVGLENAVKFWPTPTQHGNYNRAGASANSGNGLATAVKLWPTPTAVNDTGGSALCKWGGAGARAKLKTMVSHAELNGALNPMWVEWLMGYPEGWTDLKDSEIQ
jgi:DNA (cytosine-5)-methyltransferase 1